MRNLRDKRFGKSWINRIIYFFDPPRKKLHEERNYKKYLTSAEANLDAKIAANACPKSDLSKFTILGSVGAGQFGVVLQARYYKDRTPCVVKIQNKQRAAGLSKPLAPVEEKKIHAALDSEFIVKLLFAFQDPTNLYLVMEFAAYGDLFSQLEGTSGYFDETTVKFFTAQIVLALEYLHACKVLYRDLKPENVMVFDDGYLKCGDFGLSKKVSKETFSFAGTLHYMAPEMILSKAYGKSVDWWSLGATVFAMFYKSLPFTKFEWSQRQNTESILHNPLEFPVARATSEQAMDFMKQLLQRDVSSRLGAMEGESEDVKSHAWFDFDFLDIYHKRTKLEVDLIPVDVRPYNIHVMVPRNPEPDYYEDLYVDF